MMPIVLSTINASWSHPAFGLRCLLANLGPLQARARILEFTLEQRAVDCVEALLAGQPRIVGLGIYVWNAALMTEVVTLLRAIAPEVVIVLGGPEVSHEAEAQPMCALADYVIQGEGDVVFRELCQSLLQGHRPAERIIPGGLPDLTALTLPYDLYTDEDCAHRVIYVEASRGCPYACEFCLSALDTKVRSFPLDALLCALRRLLDRGVRRFKFVDRTFNLSIASSTAILKFFLDHVTPESFVHFEMVPDRFPPALRSFVAAFPPGALQFEVGIQTLTPHVEALVSRRQDHAKLADNLVFLGKETGVHVHADLIAGLPGETAKSFGQSFDALWSLGPHEIQVGILKRLRGAPISRHIAPYSMVFSPFPPYEILSTHDMDFATMQRLKRFARYWDIFANSGYFSTALRGLLARGDSPFRTFSGFTDWLWSTIARSHAISVQRQAELLWEWATQSAGISPAEMAGWLFEDLVRLGRRDPFPALAPWIDAAALRARYRERRHTALPRQSRHHGAAGSDFSES